PSRGTSKLSDSSQEKLSGILMASHRRNGQQLVAHGPPSGVAVDKDVLLRWHQDQRVSQTEQRGTYPGARGMRIGLGLARRVWRSTPRYVQTTSTRIRLSRAQQVAARSRWSIKAVSAIDPTALMAFSTARRLSSAS